jgi:hypothetical protein
MSTQALKKKYRATSIATAVVATTVLTGCMMFQVPDSVDSRDFLNGTEFLLTEPYVWRIGNSRHSIAVPAGFVTDFASIPAPLRTVFERHGRYSRAAVIHDYLYWTQSCTRKQADNLFWIAMKELNVPAVTRGLVYTGVDVGGGSAWQANRNERRQGMPKIVPVAYYPLSNTHTWKSARTELVRRGVRDPATAPDAAYCAAGNVAVVP